MKKILAALLALTMALSMAACANNTDAPKATVPETTAPEATTEAPTEETTEPALSGSNEPSVEAPADNTLLPLFDAIYENAPMELMVMNTPVDLSNANTEDGMYALKYVTGLESAELITEAAVSESPIGPTPYSMVLVRVADAANAQTVAEAMKNGIDQRKWICVEADDLLVTAKDDVVMLIMIGSVFAEDGVTAQYFVDAFETAFGGADFVLE